MFGLKFGLTYGKLIPTPGRGNVCPLTPALARYGSSDSKTSNNKKLQSWSKRGEERCEDGKLRKGEERRNTQKS